MTFIASVKPELNEQLRKIKRWKIRKILKIQANF